MSAKKKGPVFKIRPEPLSRNAIEALNALDGFVETVNEAFRLSLIEGPGAMWRGAAYNVEQSAARLRKVIAAAKKKGSQP
jgi:hypothetical protein